MVVLHTFVPFRPDHDRQAKIINDPGYWISPGTTTSTTTTTTLLRFVNMPRNPVDFQDSGRSIDNMSFAAGTTSDAITCITNLAINLGLKANLLTRAQKKKSSSNIPYSTAFHDRSGRGNLRWYQVVNPVYQTTTWVGTDWGVPQSVIIAVCGHCWGPLKWFGGLCIICGRCAPESRGTGMRRLQACTWLHISALQGAHVCFRHVKTSTAYFECLPFWYIMEIPHVRADVESLALRLPYCNICFFHRFKKAGRRSSLSLFCRKLVNRSICF